VKQYDVAIVGAGPAGMFTARELALRSKLRVLIIDEGKDVRDRLQGDHYDPADIMRGVGGTGTFSDGTLNLRPDVGGDLYALMGHDEAWDLVNYVDEAFLDYGAPSSLSEPKGQKLAQLKRKAAAAGMQFIEARQRHIGSDRTPGVIERFKKDLEARGVEFKLQTRATDLLVEDKGCKGVVADHGVINATNVLVAPGRGGALWLEQMVAKHGIEASHGPIDMGVRVEVPAIVMEPITAINRDPKFHVRTKRYDDFVRTFCTNHQGFVVCETYNDFIGVNGHSLKGKQSPNTNFSLLVQVNLTEPLEDTTSYGRSVARLATTIGGGKPLLQRMGDLRRGRRSTWPRIERNPVKATLRDVTPGDISMALPHRVVMDLIEGLETLNEAIPGVSADSTLLYAPEIKFYAIKVAVDPHMETSLPGLWAAGDGAGLSRGIIGAAATGILAGRGILSKR